MSEYSLPAPAPNAAELPLQASQASQMAAAIAGRQDFPHGCLYVVATPIGNLADLTWRALHVLALADVIACEDTRTSRTLLRYFGVEKPLLALHQHNERTMAAQICARLSAGARIAYISDAGTPAVSDPGAILVQMVASAGHRVIPLPGASSAMAALSVAGDTLAQGFFVAGFLPNKAQERATHITRWRAARESIIIFEAPHRIEALAAALGETLADSTPSNQHSEVNSPLTATPRLITVCRELTKQFEQVETMPVGLLPAWLAQDANRRRGEFVLVLHAAAPLSVTEEALPPEAQRVLRVLLRELPLKHAAALASELLGLPRKHLYAQALAWRATEESSAASGDKT